MRKPSRLFDRNPVLRLVLLNAAMGAAFGLAFAVALVLLDAHGVGSLLQRSDSGLVAFILLAAGFMVTFGSLVAGSAIMMMPDDGDDGFGGGGGGGPGGRRALRPVRVRAARRR